MSKLGRIVHYAYAADCFAAVVVKDWGNCANLHVFEANPFDTAKGMDINPTSVCESQGRQAYAWHDPENCR